MTPDSNPFSGSDNQITNQMTASLSDRYPQQISISGLPEEYETFTVDSPALIEHLQTDLFQMSSLRSHSCFSDVKEKISEFLEADPTFAPTFSAPQMDCEQSTKSAHLTTFIIGLELDSTMLHSESGVIKPSTQLVTDAMVSGIVDNRVGTTEEEIVWTNPDLLRSDYLLLCQVLDGVIYSSAVAGDMTVGRLTQHLGGGLTLRNHLLMEIPSFYKDIYNPTLDSLLNEHYKRHYRD